MKIALGSDHGGFDTKERIKGALALRGIQVEDVGCFSKDSVDYPDYARKVAVQVARKSVDEGILVCTTGIGMSMAANKVAGVRAALVCSPDMAVKARTHNDANILVLGGGMLTATEAETILEAWLSHQFTDEERHRRRVGKIDAMAPDAESGLNQGLRMEDPEIYAVLEAERSRQEETFNLIASENHVSRAVLDAQGSVLTNKYAEGYPDKRWYNGCGFADAAERMAIERALKLFGAEHVNVQAHSGSTANMAVYLAALEPGDTILSMRLAHGGHLTHGNTINFSGRLFNIVSYGVRSGTERIDYDDVARMAREARPKLIVAGASAYPRLLDFKRFREIADEVGARLMVDMAHIAGLVAAGCHPSPIPYADFVTSTTHKTLRGPRGGMIFCRAEFAQDIDRQIFPGVQGGPLMHVVAAKAVCFHEALKPAFKEYGRQIVLNAAAMAAELQAAGYRLVSGGTDNHLMLVDLSSTNITGRDAAMALECVGIVANKNAIPFDQRGPAVTSGIRLGTPAITSRGMKEDDVKRLTTLIVKVLRDVNGEATLRSVRSEVTTMATRFPVPAGF